MASLNHLEPGALALRRLRNNLLTSTGKTPRNVRITLFRLDLAMQRAQLLRVIVTMASRNLAATGQLLAQDLNVLPSQSGEVLPSLNMWALDPSSVELCVHEGGIGRFYLDANLAIGRITIVEFAVPVPEVLHLDSLTGIDDPVGVLRRQCGMDPEFEVVGHIAHLDARRSACGCVRTAGQGLRRGPRAKGLDRS